MKWMRGLLLALILLPLACKNKEAAVQPAPVVSAPAPTDSVPVVVPPVPLPKDTTIYFTISLVGDIMSHQSQINNARQADGTYNYYPSFEVIKPWLQQADVTIGNLETTFGGTAHDYMGYPVFNTPDELAPALKDAGFDIMVTANNHSMDTQLKGLKRTIKVLKDNGLEYSGTFLDSTDRDSIKIHLVKDQKLAVLSYTYGVNGNLPSDDHSYALNVIDSVAICTDITKARKKGADLVLVYLHYGLENLAEPNKKQREAVALARNCGADLIIGAHSHVIGPAEYYMADSTARLKQGFVAYGLGNFLSILVNVIRKPAQD